MNPLRLLALGALAATALSAFVTLRTYDMHHAELAYYSLSPLGESAGRSVPASCPSNLHDVPNYGQSCQTSPNICGMRNYGTIQCDGQCSVQYPPSNTLCSNVCGNLACDAGETAGSCPGDCAVVNATGCTVSASPVRIIERTRTIISWASQGSSSCTVEGFAQDTGQTIQSFVGSGNGSQPSVQLSTTTRYVVTCTASDGAGASCTSGNFTVEVVPLPKFQES